MLNSQVVIDSHPVHNCKHLIVYCLQLTTSAVIKN